MKAITLTQPWASLVAIGAKTIETRDWNTSFRGRIAIHAAKGFPKDARYLVTEPPFTIALGGIFATQLPFASIIAIATIAETWQFNAKTLEKIRERSATGGLPPFEGDFGDYGVGRFGFRLVDVVQVKRPVPARGMLGLWNLPRDVEAIVQQELAA